MKYTILFLLFVTVCYGDGTDNIVNVECGINEHKKQTEIMWYQFNQEIEEGQIQFYGKVYQMTQPIFIYLYRGLGAPKDLEYNSTLHIQVSALGQENWFRVQSKPLNNNGWYDKGTFTIYETLFNHDDDNVLTITILKDRFEIYSNEVHKWTSSRIVDPGMTIKAAAIKGHYQPEKITLICERTAPQNIPREDDDEHEN